ncbi:hypothetical protein GBAR_LOCUS7279, partial [Geodia barretti]
MTCRRMINTVEHVYIQRYIPLWVYFRVVQLKTRSDTHGEVALFTHVVVFL